MKYKFGFVQEIKSVGNSILYRSEILEIMRKYGMDSSKIEESDMMRWYPNEVFSALEKE